MTDRDRSLPPRSTDSSDTDDPHLELGRYQLLRLIGRGGMGEVFEAWDTQLERRVAIKMLGVDHSDDLALREARCLARVAHPNVVAVHDAGRIQGLVVIVMELVDGPDLRGWLRERSRRWPDVLEVLLAAAEGLAAVHRAGLVHGDVKPGNVLLGADGRVCIADFGLARVRARGADPRLAALVRHAVSLEQGSDGDARGPEWSVGLELDETPGPRVGGSRAYMAPECLAGAAGCRLADQYSLCATAWEALFGRRPFAGDSAEAILVAIATGELDRGRGRPRAMPAAIEAVLRRGLHEDPRARWPSVDALCQALIQARGRWKRAAGGALALAVGGVLVGSILGLSRARAGSEAVDAACSDGLAALDRRWAASERARLERRMFDDPRVVWPRRELRFVTTSLDEWAGEWRDLWRRACPIEAEVRACLIHERARFEAVVGLLIDETRPAEASAAVGRALVAELGHPSVCLDASRRPPVVDELGELARFGELEYRVELAARAGDLAAAEAELDRLESRLTVMGAVAPEARVRVARWRSHLLIARGRYPDAEPRLRAALAEAERLDLQRLRFDLLLDRVRLAHARGEPSLDELAALHSLADRLELGVEARAELALVEARALAHQPREALERLDPVLHLLDAAMPPRFDLELALVLARGHMRVEAGLLDEALADAQAARALALRAQADDPDSGALVDSDILLARASARARRCDLTELALDGLRGHLRAHLDLGGEPLEPLERLLTVIGSFESPLPVECRNGRQDAWAIAASLSLEAEWLERRRKSPRAIRPASERRSGRPERPQHDR